MRLVFISILTLIFTSLKAQHSSGTYSNLSRKISVNIKNQPLSIVLNKISAAGNFYFSYSGDVLKSDSSVSVYAQNKSIKTVLTDLFKDEVQYRESGKYIILRSVSRRFSIVPEVINSTDDYYEIAGYVYEEDTHSTVKDASVYERNLLKTVLTNQEGFFSLKFKGEHKGVVLTVSKENFRDTTLSFLSSVTILPEGSYIADGNNDGTVNLVERLGINRFLITSRQRIQSLNIPSVIANSPFQASFLPGLSSHGTLSSQIVNKGSLNVLGGYTAGVNGVEVAGLFNISKKDVKNVQAAGLMNMVGGSVQGVQAAGLFNVVLDSVKGVQAAGLFNSVGTEVDGVQAAGLANIVRQHVKGSQFAGLCNINQHYFEGLQVAGLTNFSGKSTDGVQIAGLGNITSKTLKGVQIGGLFNFAKRMNGTQIGLINVADTSSGYSIGLLNLVRKGYHKISLSSNEVTDANISIKTGNSKLYTMLIMGANFSKSQERYAPGLGMGHDFLFSNKLSLSAELSLQYLHLANEKGTNLLKKVQANIQWQFVKGLTLFAGPSYSIHYTDGNSIPVNGLKQHVGPQHRKSLFNDTLAWLGYSIGITLM